MRLCLGRDIHEIDPYHILAASHRRDPRYRTFFADFYIPQICIL